MLLHSAHSRVIGTAEAWVTPVAMTDTDDSRIEGRVFVRPNRDTASAVGETTLMSGVSQRVWAK